MSVATTARSPRPPRPPRPHHYHVVLVWQSWQNGYSTREGSPPRPLSPTILAKTKGLAQKSAYYTAKNYQQMSGRTPGGHFLVSLWGSARAMRYELGRRGSSVWDYAARRYTRVRDVSAVVTATACSEDDPLACWAAHPDDQITSQTP